MYQSINSEKLKMRSSTSLFLLIMYLDFSFGFMTLNDEDESWFCISIFKVYKNPQIKFFITVLIRWIKSRVGSQLLVFDKIIMSKLKTKGSKKLDKRPSSPLDNSTGKNTAQDSEILNALNLSQNGKR